MPAVAGRSHEPRSVASVGTTLTSTAITYPAGALSSRDVGRPIQGTGIPAGATVASAGSTSGTLSAAATATGTVTAIIGRAGSSQTLTEQQAQVDRQGFLGFSPESDAEAGTYTVAGGASASSPDRITSPGFDQRAAMLRTRA